MTMEKRYFRCQKCGDWFEAPPLAEHQTVGLSKMEKCPLCDRWGIYPQSEARSSPDASRIVA